MLNTIFLLFRAGSYHALSVHIGKLKVDCKIVVVWMRGQLQEGEFVEPSNNGVEIRDLGIGGREEKRE